MSLVKAEKQAAHHWKLIQSNITATEQMLVYSIAGPTWVRVLSRVKAYNDDEMGFLPIEFRQ